MLPVVVLAPVRLPEGRSVEHDGVVRIVSGLPVLRLEGDDIAAAFEQDIAFDGRFFRAGVDGEHLLEFSIVAQLPECEFSGCFSSQLRDSEVVAAGIQEFERAVVRRVAEADPVGVEKRVRIEDHEGAVVLYGRNRIIRVPRRQRPGVVAAFGVHEHFAFE